MPYKKHNSDSHFKFCQQLLTELLKYAKIHLRVTHKYFFKRQQKSGGLPWAAKKPWRGIAPGFRTGGPQ